MREIGIKFGEPYQRLPYPQNLGKRSKLGGSPEWIQNDETPVCLSCKKKMSFVGQLDSIDYEGTIHAKHEEYMFGDVGMIYIFFCSRCGKVESIFQE
ncbi:MAG: hypothetical protein CVV52_09975 [Spirochaetae bacterium HGW-Spirochaetae-8]|nr:MAG: hypothetical protein CVV52_09975 [Spirochaetae bacterium HGW-Spirochaetae-8]